MPMPTLLDIAKRNGTDEVVGLIEEASRATPEVSGLNGRGQTVIAPAARTISGRQYKTRVRTAVPKVGFRNANEGSAAVKSTWENRLVETFIINPRFECDKAVADSAEDGPEAYIAEEKAGIMEGAFQCLAKVFYYGTNADLGDPKGFPGLVDLVDDSMELDATGNDANKATSVWAVRFGLQHVRWVWGENGLLQMSENRLESLQDDAGARFTAYVSELLAYAGLQVGSIYSVARIKNLTAQAGKGLTDGLLATLLTKFPVGVTPDALFMTKQSLEQLRQSRTATNATGAPAPTPTEYEGIPILPTEAILNTEPIA